MSAGFRLHGYSSLSNMRCDVSGSIQRCFGHPPPFWSDWPPPLLSSRALRKSVIVCKQCGTELPDHARFCLQCGASILPPQEQEEPPSPVPVQAGPKPELDFVQPALT